MPSFTTTPQRRPRRRRRRNVDSSSSPSFSFSNPIFIRRYSSRRIKDTTLIVDPHNFVGIYSPWAFLWGSLFLLVPICYLYIFLVVVRELFPQHLLQAGEAYFPILHQWTLASTISNIIAQQRASSSAWMQHATSMLSHDSTTTMVDDSASSSSSSTTLLTHHPRQSIWLWIEVWCYLEAIFFILLKIKIRWLQCKDPLEASLSAAPLMELGEREALWQRMMSSIIDNPVTYLSGWFFDQDVSEITLYDVRDFCAWSMFEGRHQEHLTTAEVEQLEKFVEELRIRISLQMYGAVDDDDEEEAEDDEGEDGDGSGEERNYSPLSEYMFGLPKPKKFFEFPEETSHAEGSFFSDLYESYRRRYDQMEFSPVQDFRNMVQRAGDNFHPVQDLRNLVAETAHHVAEVEASAMATATQTATHMYETVVPPGSMVDKQLTAMSHSTYLQLQEAWNSVRNMKERLETARFLFKQRQRLRQQLKGYRVMLMRMREMSSGVPSNQMAALMRRITECYEAMEHLEGRAQTAFTKATGFALKNMPFLQRKPPQRFAKYSSDPLLGLATYPLFFHLLVLGCTDIPLRIKLAKRGFERRTVGPVSYYYHPGNMAEEYFDDDEDYDEKQMTPLVFVHGIGIGLISYLSLIDGLLQTGRPVFLPEIPYVCGFRPWQSPNAVLPPAAVSSTMTAMLATHGFLSATWIGHSYGTSWLSYVVKYAPEVVAAACFLDPICFCLHWPRLTKSFVYMKPDPGTISYIVRTDVIVNWTIQRSFPWQWIALFNEMIQVPCAIFLSEKDLLVPSDRVEQYMKSDGVPIQDFETLREEITQQQQQQQQQQQPQQQEQGGEDVAGDTKNSNTSSPRMTCTIFKGAGHGDWTEQPGNIPTIVHTVERLCRQIELDDDDFLNNSR